MLTKTIFPQNHAITINMITLFVIFCC